MRYDCVSLRMQGMQKNETDTDVRLAATVALYNALEFAHSNFNNDSERNYLMQARALQIADGLQRVSSSVRLEKGVDCVLWRQPWMQQPRTTSDEVLDMLEYTCPAVRPDLSSPRTSASARAGHLRGHQQPGCACAGGVLRVLRQDRQQLLRQAAAVHGHHLPADAQRGQERRGGRCEAGHRVLVLHLRGGDRHPGGAPPYLSPTCIAITCHAPAVYFQCNHMPFDELIFCRCIQAAVAELVYLLVCADFLPLCGHVALILRLCRF